MPPPDLAALIQRLADARPDRLTHLVQRPARDAVFAPWPTWVAPDVRSAFEASGIQMPYSHQVEAAELAWSRSHVVLSTGTASGKSLGFHLPALSAIRAARGPRQQRGASVLYLAPTKALAHDQRARLQSLDLDVRICAYDGDCTDAERIWARDHGEYVLSNPDMIHRSLLPRHQRWSSFLGSLEYVVIDECHHYRGVFGSHVAQVLRRLRRVCELHGSSPTFVLASATVAEPETTAAALIGEPVTAVTDDGSPRGPLTTALWQPPLTSFTGENGAPQRRSAGSETADLLADLVASDVRTLAFVRSRAGVESVARSAASLLADVDPELPQRVAAYRGGYLPEERRDIEHALRDGSLLGLAATNALELGIDISGLDAVVVAGYPGRRAALWQQWGRAGRGTDPALAIMVARDDPLDTYFVTHPDVLLDAAVEATVLDPTNPYVLAPHLCAAAQEQPLTLDDVDFFGEALPDLLDRLVDDGRLRRRGSRGWFWTSDRRAVDEIDLRSAGQAVQLVEEGTGRVVGTMDGSTADSQAHEGAVYVHRGQTYVVRRLDLEEHVAVVGVEDPGYSTMARSVTDFRLLSTLQSRQWGAATVSYGELKVSSQVVSYLKRKQPSGEVFAEEPLEMPVRTLRTAGTWWVIPAEHLSTMAPYDLGGSAHAAEHCSIGLLPLVATCDRWDIGGVSTVRHPDTGELTVVVYDGHPGGAGLAARGFEAAREWLTATREAIMACTCESGCPSCVQSPKCGNQNNPLDKNGAVELLRILLDGPEALI
ncbi:helicase [Nocardioides baekrokdamisoli]|uniref:Helicase n=1 Tax=Nocardioides baekrokdamisoli TaxID=1804624 RepID=A0A3G9INT7_9ACTN|nr:DEAD/DEAH box helicase [Nocardioides baekrokdamisoli]BBH17705.1 helicase [Nocardioides baekrokdamisoli]